MRIQILLILGLLIVSCGKTETAPSTNDSGVQVESSTAAPFSLNAPANTGNGPTGVSDDVIAEELPGHVPPAQGNDPIIVNPGPVLIEVCGVAYSSFYDDVIRLYINENLTHILSNGDSSADYYFSANRLSYPNDAVDVCVKSYMDNGLLVASSVKIITRGVANPERELIDSYLTEICGVFKYVTGATGRTTLEVTRQGVAYIVVDNNLPALALPDFTGPEVRGCMYSNSALYNDFSYTFKKHLSVDAFDFGPLIP